MFELNSAEQMVVEMARDWVDQKVKPVVQRYEHTDTYPAELVDQMKELGFFGLMVPEEYGGNRVSTLCFARVTEEIARGWMSLSGALGSHSVTAYLVLTHGTEEQRRRYLPGMATGEARAAMALTEPGGGSDLQAITTFAAREGDTYVINGAKTFITNAQHARYFSLLAKTDRQIQPAHRGISLFLAEAGPGLHVTRKLDKLGYKGTETCELSLEEYRTPAGTLLGHEGAGFALMMDGLEVGRIQVACRALGVAAAALEDSIVYAQQRVAFGKPIWQHQAVGHHLAEMATKLEAARLLTYQAAALKDRGRRCDMEAGMAKYYASEVCGELTLTAMRIFGGYGYMKEFNVERYYRDAPLMIIGEGTNEIQKNVIARQLINRNRI
jgi:alkylation response protein AidB-like acyl-CoA dehydrogenase